MKFRAPAGAFVVVALMLAGCTGTSSNGQAANTPSIPGIDNTESDLSTLTDSATDTATDTATDPTSAPATPSSPATRSSSPTTPAPSKTAPRSSFSPPPGSLAACALPYVAVTAKPASGGDSHEGVILLFRNTGQIACALTGYPGAALVNAKGQQVKQAARTPAGYLGGLRKGKPTAIALASGATASALLEGEVVDVNGKTCAATPALLITPPNTTTSVKLKISTTMCGGTQIHPVVTGTTGSSQ